MVYKVRISSALSHLEITLWIKHLFKIHIDSWEKRGRFWGTWFGTHFKWSMSSFNFLTFFLPMFNVPINSNCHFKFLAQTSSLRHMSYRTQCFWQQNVSISHNWHISLSPNPSANWFLFFPLYFWPWSNIPTSNWNVWPQSKGSSPRNIPARAQFWWQQNGQDNLNLGQKPPLSGMFNMLKRASFGQLYLVALRSTASRSSGSKTEAQDPQAW